MDILFKEKTSYILAAITAAAGCILMICFPDTVMFAVKKSISIWMTDVLPAMLPFFICANFLMSLGITAILPAGMFPFVMSVISGYPIGAKITGDMVRMGTIDVREGKRLLSFCSTSGPVFMIGAIGAGMLASQRAGIIIAVSHYAGALCNGALFSFIYGKEKISDREKEELDGSDLIGKFTESILQSFKSMTMILAYIILFMFITDMLAQAGIFDMFRSEILSVISRGVFEMTVGCSFAASADITARMKCVLSAVMISWGGLSIAGQTISMLSDTGIPVRYVFITKFFHSLFTGIIALFITGLML